MKEEKLIRDLKWKKRDALEKAIEAYGAYVGTIVSRILGGAMGREDVEEIVSDTFLALWKHAESLTAERGELKAYLAAIARNLAKNRLRKKRITVPLEGDALFSGPAFWAEGPEGELLRKEAADVVRRAVLGMGEPDREIFLRYYYSYEKVEEIAAILNMNPATVKTKLARGRKKLRITLEERGYGDGAADYGAAGCGRR